MRIRISFTHGFNLFQQILIYPITLVGGVLAAIAIGESDVSNIFVRIISFVVWIAATGAIGFGLYKVIDPVSTMLYLLFSCKTKVSYTEARKVSFLFNGELNGKWYPFYSLGDVPEEFRKEVLFEFADRIKFGNFSKEKREFTNQGSNERQTDQNKSESYRKPEMEMENEKKTRTYNEEYREACSIIGIKIGHSKEELKSGYRKQMMKYHPDLYANADPDIKAFAHEKASKINNAYSYLEKREFA